jgi:hypothetical protein
VHRDSADASLEKETSKQNNATLAVFFEQNLLALAIPVAKRCVERSTVA